ncbi:MAG: hypothetical protein JO293_03510 [Candidatus Eremiobacteraeota bacterium]|nr:hypothetical protein [Candidatus Eremiobacteraeota bacterium]
MSVETPQARRAAAIARALRGAGLRVVLDVSDRWLDRKLRNADKLGSPLAVIIGEDEAHDGTATIRDLSRRAQETVSEQAMVAAVTDALERLA